jgi:glycosyltransferase involved in cell wall biosynthesis
MRRRLVEREVLMQVTFLAGQLGEQDGWARFSHGTVRYLAERGVRCRVLVSSESPRAKELDGESNSLVIYPVLPSWPQTPLRWMASSAAALPWIARHLSDCDLVHCLTEPYVSLSALVSFIKGKPLVVSAVGTYSVLTVGKRFSPFTFWARRAKRIVCISRYTESRIRIHNPSAETAVINPGVDHSRFTPGKPVGRPADIKGRVILSVGAVKPRKGYDVAVRALSRLDEGLRDAGLYVVGGRDSHPAYTKRLLVQAESLGVGKRVHLLGRVDEKELLSWYRRADVFLLNSTNLGQHFEGYGLVLLEANACGKPVVGCLECGAEDIVQSGENGILVPQNDPDRTAEALTRILGDSELSQRMGKEGLRRASQLSWERSADEMEALYQSILARSRKTDNGGRS